MFMLTLLKVWFSLGFLFLATMFAMEFIAFALRPDYKDYILESKSEKSNHKFIKFLVFWLATWPIHAIGIIRALVKNQTYIEYREGEEAKAKAQERIQLDRIAALFKIDEETKAIIQAAPFRWELDTDQAFPILCLTRTLPTGVEVQTHAIVIPKDDTKPLVCLRAMPKPEDSLVFGLLPNKQFFLEKGLAVCEADVDWSFLCVPGMEKTQREIWKLATASQLKVKVSQLKGKKS